MRPTVAAVSLKRALWDGWWQTSVIHALAVLYAIPDGVSLLLVRRMARTTVAHHVLVLVFALLIVAQDQDVGLWRALEVTGGSSSPPIIYEAGGVRQLIIWHTAGLASLDPETGAVYWEEPWEVGASMNVITPLKSDNAATAEMLFTSRWKSPSAPSAHSSRPVSSARSVADGQYCSASPPV